jgi:nucleoside-diphosphate-sugar epimerase
MVKEKVLVTGGAGYLGSVLTGHLLEEGYGVTCLDNLMHHQNSLIIYAHHPDFEFVYGDSRDKGLVKKLVSESDSFIPLAALVGMPLCGKNPKGAKEINTNSIIMLNELRSNNQKLIFPNTNSGYGTSTGEVYCTEETPLEPISAYGVTKCNAESHLLNSENKGAITLRLATVFGISPRMRTDLLVNDFVLQAVTNRSLVLFEKDFKRNYIHIRDVARAFVFGLENYDEMEGRPYNLGLEDANLSKLELAEKIKGHVPELEILDAPIGKDPDKRNYIVSNQRILQTGFTPRFSLDEGIVELMKGYNILLKNNPFANA